MRRIAVIAASAALVFAACGSEDEEPAATPAATEALTETELTADAGEVEIDFKNPSQVPHAVVIEGVDGAATETVQGGDAPPVTVNLEPGEYTFFCPVGDHRADGMEGKLSVR
jgi:plastocyanin